jgi:hypothetical protein
MTLDPQYPRTTMPVALPRIPGLNEARHGLDVSTLPIAGGLTWA